MIFRIFLTTIICVSLFQNAIAQEIPSSAGGDMAGTDATVSYTIGQVAFGSTSGATGSELQGVQQPYEIYAVVGTEEATEDQEGITVFPNPATNHLIIALEGVEARAYRFMDMSGHILMEGSAMGAETSIDLSGVAQASYLLQVSNKRGKYKSFKIVKN